MTKPTPKRAPTLAIGPLSRRGTGQHWVGPQQDFSQASRVCNAAMPDAAPGEITKIMAGVQRPGSDHKAIKSRGAGC